MVEGEDYESAMGFVKSRRRQEIRDHYHPWGYLGGEPWKVGRDEEFLK